VIRRIRAIGAVTVTLGLLAMPGCSSSSGSSLPSTPIGTVADTGFRPGANGFSFQNYGFELPNGAVPVNLTAADVEKMFGDSVCVDAKLRRCDLIPEAQAWLNDTNDAISGGHCYGFSVLAELIWLGRVSPSTFGGRQATSLDVDTNETLQRQIAYDWALQLLGSVQAKRLTGTPNQILAQLVRGLKPHPSQTYTVVFWKRDGSGGHAVTPFEVVNSGGGMYKVLIYDNNWPGQTRAISFNTKADTWTYDAASNPNEPESVYEGDAKTKTLSLYPTSPGLGRQPCPFCAKEPTSGTAKAGDNTEEISLQGGATTEHADLVVSDDAGQQLGYINGNLVNQIPGARVDQVISSGDWTDNLAPDFFVPADVKYTITLDGTSLKTPDSETLSLIGPSYDLSIGPIPIRPGDKDTLVIEPDATQLSYTSSRTESPTITLGVSDDRADYSFQIAGISDQPGSTLNLGLPPEGGNLNLQHVGGTSSVNLKMTRSNEQGVHVFAHNAIPLVGVDRAQLQFGNWTTSTQGIPLVLSHNGQQSTQVLADQQPS
jgi:hypothetical protein